MRDELGKLNEVDAIGTDVDDAILASALRDYRTGVRAWSDAAYHRARPVAASAPRRVWRHSVVWALSLVLSGGIAGTAAYEHHRQAVIEQQQAQQRELERQRTLAAEREREAENLLANVDSDVSRQVPEAMEPLAALMSDDIQ